MPHKRMPFGLLEKILRKLMQGLAPHLPLMVAGIGAETYLHTSITHLLYDVAGVRYTGVLLSATEEEHVELLVCFE